MKRFVVFMLSLGIILAAPSCFASYIAYGGGFYGGGYGGMRRPQQQYYYRPTYPVTPAMTRHNTVPATPVSCLGTSSYVVIGNNVMPCKSAAATRIKVSDKTNKSSIKKQSGKTSSKISKNKKDKDAKDKDV